MQPGRHPSPDGLGLLSSAAAAAAARGARKWQVVVVVWAVVPVDRPHSERLSQPEEAAAAEAAVGEVALVEPVMLEAVAAVAHLELSTYNMFTLYLTHPYQL